MNSLPILSFYKNINKTKAHIAHKSLNINGHKRSHPYSVPFSLGCKNKHVIINPIHTFDKLCRSLYLVGFFSNNKKSLLIVNTNKDLFNLIENFYQSTVLKNLPVYYCNEKWVGGFLTNWKQVRKSVYTFMEFSKRFGNFIAQNNIHFPRYKRMNQSFKGIAKTAFDSHALQHNTIEKPDLIFLINPNQNRHIVEEALALNIPIIAITDSNTNLAGISCPIPGNSNSIEFVHYCLQWITRIYTKPTISKNQNKSRSL